MALRLDPGRWLLGPVLGLSAAILGLLAGVEPRIALLLAFGCAFVLLAFTSLGAGLAIFAFISFTDLLPSAGGAVSVTKLVGLLLGLAWLAAITTGDHPEESFIAAHPTASALIGLFLVWIGLSMTWSESPSSVIEPLTRAFLDAILLMVVFTAVRTRGNARLLVGAFIVGALAATLYGLATSSLGGQSDRLGTTVFDPNELAAVLVAGAALALGLAVVSGDRPLVRFMALASVPFCLTGIFLTLSRGGLIALGVTLVAAIVFAGPWRLAVAACALFVAFSAVFYFNSFAPQSAKDRVTHVSQGEAQTAEGRQTIWQVAERAFSANPIQGIGANNFQRSARHYVLQPGSLPRTDQIISEPRVVHNSYLEVLAELGLVGFALFGSIIVFALGSMLAAAKRFAQIPDRPMQAFTLSVLVAVVGALAAYFFISEEYSKQLWLLLGLGPALLAIASAPRDTAES